MKANAKKSSVNSPRANTCVTMRTICCLVGLLNLNLVTCARWSHSAQLGPDYTLLWSLGPGLHDITFEVQVKTHGYIAFGLSRDGRMPGADFVVGWVDNGQVYFQDRHVKSTLNNHEALADSNALEVDPSQDYQLLLGYENTTHTVLRFRRKLNTCDQHDIAITNDTMRALWIMHNEKPRSGQGIPGHLPTHDNAMRGNQSLYFLQRVNQETPRVDEAARTWELRNTQVKLPLPGDSLYWCRVFKLPSLTKKHHLIRYEPILDDVGKTHLRHAVLYECQESLEATYNVNHTGQSCQKLGSPPLSCNLIVASWTRGSEGFTFPPEAGYPFEAHTPRYYVLETHYSTPITQDIRKTLTDNSGLRLFYTPELRRHDAGLLSIGIEPNWRHIIPPRQGRVTSSGHCVSECTKQGFSEAGVTVFAVVMRIHSIGREIKLRQIRGSTELPAIFEDDNLNTDYQEYRRLETPVKVLPGDHLIVECNYDSSQRTAITLGGLSEREETCMVTSLYYPLQRKLTTCHSLPSLPTVLHSLGIMELQKGSNPLRISSPSDLAGMTLESRLLTFDWQNHFREFQQATMRGSFRPRCWNANSVLLPGTETIESHYPNVSRRFQSYNANMNSQACANNSRMRQSTNRHGTGVAPSASTNVKKSPSNHYDDDNLIENASRSKVSRSPGEHTLGLSGASDLSRASLLVIFSLSVCFSLSRLFHVHLSRVGV